MKKLKTVLHLKRDITVGTLFGYNIVCGSSLNGYRWCLGYFSVVHFDEQVQLFFRVLDATFFLIVIFDTPLYHPVNDAVPSVSVELCCSWKGWVLPLVSALTWRDL